MLERVSRRRFVQGAGVAGLGLVAGCGQLPGQAAAKVPRIGVLQGGRGSPPGLAGFRESLQALGYVEGHNILIEQRYAEGDTSRLPEFVAELIQFPVDLIVVGGTLPLRAATDATDTIPIVMVIANEPVRQGFAVSFARPGGNLTGLSQMNVQLIGKQLQLLKETVPGLARVAFLWNPAIPDRAYERSETEAVAQALALRVHPLEARSPAEVEAAMGDQKP